MRKLTQYLHFIGIYLFLILLVCWVIGFVFFSLYALQFKYVPQVPVQAVVALTGGSERIETAVRILQKNNLGYLLISGVNKSVGLEDLSNKIEPEFLPKVTLGYFAENTRQNARELIQWAKLKKLDSILLVTSFYHIPRSILEIKFLDTSLNVIPYPVFPKNITDSKILIHTRSMWLLFVEYHKYMIAFVRNFFEERIKKCGFNI